MGKPKQLMPWGKSTILAMIAERAMQIRQPRAPKVEFVYAPVLWAGFFAREWRRWQEADLLLLDEFGRAYETDFPASLFESFIEQRYANRLATCIATRLTISDLKSNPQWECVLDRWREKNVLGFFWHSIPFGQEPMVPDVN